MASGVSSGYPSFVSYLTASELDTYFDNIYADGFRKVRFQYAGLGTVVETAVNAAVASGLVVNMTILANLSDTQAQYTARCQTAATEYSSRCFEWQLDNEPNIHGWSSIAAYVNVVRGGRAAILAIQPTAIVQLGSIAQWGGGAVDDLVTTSYPLNWLRGVYAVDGDFFDEVCVHPYGYYTNITGAQSFALNSAWAQMVGDADANTLRQIMVENGDTTKTISITEYGHPTWLSPWVFATYPSALGMDEQPAADATTLAIADYKTRTYLRDFYVHSYRNRAPTEFSTTQEGYFGIRHNDYTAKPARAIWVTENPSLNSGPPDSVTVSGNEITDASRIAATSTGKRYDGRTSDSSFGIWKSSTNIYDNCGLLSTAGGCFVAGTGTGSRDITKKAIGTASYKHVPVGGTLGGLYFYKKDGTTRIPVSPATQYTLSLWLMSDGALSTTPKMSVEEFNNVPAYTGLAVSGSAFTGHAADGVWRRYSFTFTTAASTVAIVPVVNSYGVNWTDSTENFYVNGMQLELGDTVTPAILTDGAATAAGTPYVYLPHTFFDETQGWVAFRVRLGFPATRTRSDLARLFYWPDTASGPQHRLAYDHSVDKWSFLRGDPDTDPSHLSAAQTFVAGDKQTIIAAWTATEVKVSVNGAAFTTVANTTIPDTTGVAWLGSGGSVSANSEIDSDILWFASGTGTLTDAHASALHAFGDTDPTIGGIGFGTAQIVWPAETIAYSAASPIEDEVTFSLIPVTPGAVTVASASAGSKTLTAATPASLSLTPL